MIGWSKSNKSGTFFCRQYNRNDVCSTKFFPLPAISSSGPPRPSPERACQLGAAPDGQLRVSPWIHGPDMKFRFWARRP